MIKRFIGFLAALCIGTASAQLSPVVISGPVNSGVVIGGSVGNSSGSTSTPVPTFWAPLQSSLVLLRGTGGPTYTRATTATITDWESKVTPVLSGEARFIGARRVRNLLIFTEDLTNGGWQKLTGLTTTATTATYVNTNSGLQMNTAGFAVGDTFACAADFSAPSSQTIALVITDAADGNPTVSRTIVIGPTVQRFGLVGTLGAGFSGTMAFQILGNNTITAGTIVTIGRPSCEYVTGQSNTNPGEYASKNVLSAPYQGANVDGVQYFTYQNGNTVNATTGVVTEAAGVPISASTSKWAYTGGVSGDYYSTPDAVANSITGDISIVACAALDSWTAPTTVQDLVSKTDSDASNFAFVLRQNTDGTVIFYTSANGTAPISQISTAAVTFSPRTSGCIRVDRVAVTGVATFFTASSFGATWTQLGNTVAAAAQNIFDSTSTLKVGARNTGGTGGMVSGKVYRVQIYNGTIANSGTLAVDFSPSSYTSGSTFTAPTGETWTLNGNASIFTGAQLWDSRGNFGYYAEGARTNICLQSEDLATTWSVAAATISTNAIASPDGKVTADKVQEDNTAAVHQVGQAITVAANTIYTASMHFKAAERTKLRFDYLDIATATNGATASVDLGLGTITAAAASGTGTYVASTITAYGNGWYRVTLTAKIDSGATTAAMLRVIIRDAAGATSYTGVTGNGIYGWGGQLELAGFASTYIPTTTVSVARNGDLLSYPSASNVSGVNGTAFARIFIPSQDTGSGHRIVSVNNALERNLLYVISGATNIAAYDGTTIRNGPVTTFNTANRVAGTWSAAVPSTLQYVNGVAGTVRGFDGDFDVNNISIGYLGFGGLYLNGAVRDVRLWLPILSTPQIAAIQ